MTLDADNDGLTNGFEYVKDMNPFSTDTDGDTFPDDIEIHFQTNPNDPECHLQNMEKWETLPTISPQQVYVGWKDIAGVVRYVFSYNPAELTHPASIGFGWITNAVTGVVWEASFIPDYMSNSSSIYAGSHRHPTLSNTVEFLMTYDNTVLSTNELSNDYVRDWGQGWIVSTQAGNFNSVPDMRLGPYEYYAHVDTLGTPGAIVTINPAQGTKIMSGWMYFSTTSESWQSGGILTNSISSCYDLLLDINIGTPTSAPSTCVSSNPPPDTDGDGLPNWTEIDYYLTDWNNSDTDNDDLTDGEEILIHHTDPLVADADNDLLLDGREIALGADPLNPYSDADGMPDGWEDLFTLNPVDSSDAFLDLDGDNLPNLYEYQFDSLPDNKDSDDDRIDDFWEFRHGLNSFSTHDALRYSNYRNNLPNIKQYIQENVPTNAVNTDGDRFTDFAENYLGLNPELADTDQDGMPDGWELAYDLNPKDSVQRTSLGDQSRSALSDTDNDKLTALEEYTFETYPFDFDTDDDGLGDGWEILHGFNPKSHMDNLVGWWRFDRVTGNNIVYDYSGYFNDLTHRC